MTSRSSSYRATLRQRLMGSVAFWVVNHLPVDWARTETPSLIENLRAMLREPLLDGELVVGAKRGEGVLQRTSSGVTNGKANPTSRSGSLIPHSLVTALETVWNSPTRLLPDLGHERIRFHDTGSYPRPTSLKDMLTLS
jgi:hypothetical protein